MVETKQLEGILYQTELISVKRYPELVGFIEQHPSAYNQLVLTYVDSSEFYLRIKPSQTESELDEMTVLSIDKIYSSTRDRTYDFNDFNSLVKERAAARGIELSEKEIGQKANEIVIAAVRKLAETGFDGTPRTLPVKKGVAGYRLARVEDGENKDALERVYGQLPSLAIYSLSFTEPIEQYRQTERAAAEQKKALEAVNYERVLDEAVEMLRTALDKQHEDNLSARVGGYVPNIRGAVSRQDSQPVTEKSVDDKIPEVKIEPPYLSEIGTIIGFPVVIRPSKDDHSEGTVREFRRVPTLSLPLSFDAEEIEAVFTLINNRNNRDNIIN